MSPALYALALLTVFAVKHFLCDFPLQATAFMYANKGNWAHPGGYLHALVHVWATTMCLALLFNVDASLLLEVAAAEFVTHYLIDFSKVNIGKHFKLKPNNSEWFWTLLGFDQLLHGLTYIAITYFLVTHG